MYYIFFIVVAISAALSFCYKNYASDIKDVYLLRAAMLCTLSADFFMILMKMDFAGLCFFIVVQSIYTYRYAGKKRTVSLYALLILLTFILGILNTLPIIRTTALETAGAMYAICLLFSVLGAAEAFIKHKYIFPNNIIILSGMILFLLCDINVLLFYLGVSFASPLIWICYLPSQLLLAVSGKKFK